MAVFLNELLDRCLRLIAASLWAAVCTSGFLPPRPLTPSTASCAVFGQSTWSQALDGRLKAFRTWLQRETLHASPRLSASTFIATLRSNEDRRSAQLRGVNDAQDTSRILIHTLAAEPPGSSLRRGRMRLPPCKRAAPEDACLDLCSEDQEASNSTSTFTCHFLQSAFQLFPAPLIAQTVVCVPPSLDSLKVWQLQSA